MSRDYISYLFLIFFVLLFFIILITLLILRLRKKKPAVKTIPSIKAGTIGVFFDREKNIVIIPYVKDKYGAGRSTGDFLILNNPYNSKILGQNVRIAMKLCETGSPCTDNDLMLRLGFRSWKDFSEGKRNISVHYQEGHGIVYNTTRRNVDGAYQFNYMGFEKIISDSSSDEELGSILLELLPRCR